MRRVGRQIALHCTGIGLCKHTCLLLVGLEDASSMLVLHASIFCRTAACTEDCEVSLTTGAAASSSY